MCIIIQHLDTKCHTSCCINFFTCCKNFTVCCKNYHCEKRKVITTCMQVIQCPSSYIDDTHSRHINIIPSLCDFQLPVPCNLPCLSSNGLYNDNWLITHEWCQCPRSRSTVLNNKIIIPTFSLKLPWALLSVAAVLSLLPNNLPFAYAISP